MFFRIRWDVDLQHRYCPGMSDRGNRSPWTETRGSISCVTCSGTPLIQTLFYTKTLIACDIHAPCLHDFLNIFKAPDKHQILVIQTALGDPTDYVFKGFHCTWRFFKISSDNIPRRLAPPISSDPEDPQRTAPAVRLINFAYKIPSVYLCGDSPSRCSHRWKCWQTKLFITQLSCEHFNRSGKIIAIWLNIVLEYF